MKKQRTNPQPAVPVVDRNGKITLIARTPPAPGPRIRYEDLTNTVTRSSSRRSAASTLAPRIPAAAQRTRVHRAKRGSGSTKRRDR